VIILLAIGSNFTILSAMTRQWRIEFEGAYYHILSRGNERRNIFTDNDDRTSFLEILGRMSERFEVEVCAYVLMDNHYHLLLKTNKPNISKSMQWFGTTYTRRYNIKHRISDSNKLNRDLLIYLLWSTGWYNNQEIGNLFGIGYSSVSRRVSSMKSKISKDNEINKRLEYLKSLINRLSENSLFLDCTSHKSL
jgi:REP element-mobilizing transposase RayT